MSGKDINKNLEGSSNKKDHDDKRGIVQHENTVTEKIQVIEDVGFGSENAKQIRESRRKDRSTKSKSISEHKGLLKDNDSSVRSDDDQDISQEES